jgi:hypothetical protein
MNDLESALAHRYRLDGADLINVTAISGLLDDGKSGAFAGAAVKLTKAGEDYRATWKASGERGTRVHGYCESFLKGESIDMAVGDEGYVDALEKFIHDLDPQVIDLEQIVLSSNGYGGRFDMVVRLGEQIALIDVKTGKSYAAEHTLQLSAYRYADGIAEYDTDGKLTGLRPMPKIDATYCLYVHDDGEYDLTEYPADSEAWNVFLGLLDAYQWSRSDAMQEAKKR